MPTTLLLAHLDLKTQRHLCYIYSTSVARWPQQVTCPIPKGYNALAISWFSFFGACDGHCDKMSQNSRTQLELGIANCRMESAIYLAGQPDDWIRLTWCDRNQVIFDKSHSHYPKLTNIKVDHFNKISEHSQSLVMQTVENRVVHIEPASAARWP